jgi:hypothetical protein
MRYCPACGLAQAATPRRQTAVSAAPVTSGPFAPAGRDDRAAARGPKRRGASWVTAAAVAVVAAVALGVASVAAAQTRPPACGATCRRPPPPCFGITCTRALLGASAGVGTYTSSADGWSLSYPSKYQPAGSDKSSVSWDLSGSDGDYSVDVVSGGVKNKSAQQIAFDIQSQNFSDYQQVYDIPGAEIGYQNGYGAVWDEQVTPLFGQSQDTRLAIVVAERNGLAIALVGNGPAVSPDQGSADPSQLPLSGFLDDLLNSVNWPGSRGL